MGVITMLRSCAYCGRVHDRSFDCPKKPKKEKAVNDITKFRGSSKWKRLREAIVCRDRCLCCVCRSKGIYKSDDLSVHHIVPLVIDFSLRTDPDNLITLCTTHHEEAERGDIPADVLRGLIQAEDTPRGSESDSGEA